METIGVRVPKEVKEGLKTKAKKDGRTLSNLIKKILTDYLTK